MPAGFDVETGTALSAKLQGFVDKLGDWLKARRDRDDVPREIGAAGIIEYARQFHHVDLKDSDVRAMVNHLRRSRKPIASSAAGYFWAVNHQELRPTLEHMYQRISAMAQAADGLKYAEFGEARLL